MAVKLIANYSKRLGLPGYSSHQFSVSVETELNTTDDIAYEAEKLYHNLQSNVDEQIRQTGFVPPHDYGMETPAPQATTPAPGKVLPIAQHSGWQCSPKQQELILRLIEENNLDKNDIEQLALQRFRKSVPQLNKLEASGLIDIIIQQQLQDHAPSKSYKKGGQR